LTVGVDVGGTFTDVVAHDGQSIRGLKVPTTGDQSLAVIDGLTRVGAGPDSVFLHGTTAGTNALLEGRGARTALVTSPGFEDIVEIGRQARASLYDSFVDRPTPLVDRDFRLGFGGDVNGLLDELRRLSPEAVAVAMVRSFTDPGEEIELADRIAAELGVPVSAGARVSPSFREYERIATTVLNASLTPEVAGYLDRLDREAQVGRRLVMTSSGGLLPFASALGLAGRLVLSGPAAGVVAAAELGREKGYESVISFDMGGTSTDVCRIGGSPRAMRAGAGRVNRVPTLPVHTIGAGGGSLGWVDAGGALRVGPRSAGAVPGPAAYGFGGADPTVTDANVVLGRIPETLVMGGSLRLDGDAARWAVAGLGSDLGLETPAMAAGIIEVVDAHMERALRAVSVEEGVDPRGAVLVAFGGAGGLHASRLARRLGMLRAVVPPLSGVFSALGLLLARPSRDTTRTVNLGEGAPELGAVRASILAAASAVYVTDQGVEAVETRAMGEVRYAGQSHELAVPLAADWDMLRSAFETEHRMRFGFDRPGEPIELVDVSAVASGRPPLTWSDLPTPAATSSQEPARSMATVEGRTVAVTLWQRGALTPGMEIEGPGIVIDDDSAVWLDLDDHLTVHNDGTLEITW
jgi:N-methylhydantoinase A